VSDAPAPKSTLLVVDDNEMNRDMLGRRLEKKGYRVVTADSGPHALDALARETVDLVLLDIEMPGMTGMEVLKTVRQTRSASELPVIMATARHDSSDVVEALQAGANDYVTKPLDFPVVVARVEAQLRNRPKVVAVEDASSAADLGPGKVLAGKYRLDSVIGSGSFGTVYGALHLGLQNMVAVKVLQTVSGRSPEALARFQREGIAACRIKHPNAVSVMDFGVTGGGAAFLVMEFLEGRSLLEELQRVGRLDAARTADILEPLCSVLEEAHQAGILHRDIKPANVFLQRTSRGEVVKVLDFGIAKIMDAESGGEANLTMEGGIIGTPAYMAPERFRGGKPDGRSDVYSVGIMLYQMLTGRMPFVAHDNADLLAVAMLHLNREPAPLREVYAPVPAGVEEVVLGALRKEPRERPSAAALARTFKDAVKRYESVRPDPAAPRPKIDHGAETMISGEQSLATQDLKPATEEAARKAPGKTVDALMAAHGLTPTALERPAGPATRSAPRTRTGKAVAKPEAAPRARTGRKRKG
jgi:serine/threonine protein kinase